MNLLIFLFGFFTACGQQNANDVDMVEMQKEYDRHKQYFDANNITHFPNALHSKLNAMESSLSVENNNVGFLLFEFDVDERLLDSITKNVKQMNVVGLYRSSDRDLLYVIPGSIIPESPNLRRLDTNIDYSSQLPVADLDFYLGGDKYFGSYLNNDFDIYVLEAKAGKLPKYVDLLPNMNMPEKWRNGISRGISISKKGKTVVYWTIIW